MKSELKSLLKKAERILVFTGAGISTGSGIPDFRGPQGVWKKRQPVYFQDFLASEESRVEHWDFKLEGWEGFKNAKPNAAHRALVDLEKTGKIELLVTQNIDGLHHLAGQSPEKVVEIHGTNRLVECLDCAKQYDPDPYFAEFRKTRSCPKCPCGGFLKAATISFGQAMPQDKLERAFASAAKADLVLALGSSLTVEPAASIPLAGARNGAPYVIINQGETAHDALATLRLEGDVAVLLPEAVAGLGS